MKKKDTNAKEEKIKIKKRKDKKSSTVEVKVIDAFKFDVDNLTQSRKTETKLFAFQLENIGINNPIVIVNNENDASKIKSKIGTCEYQFRKGVGYVGEVFRLVYCGAEQRKNEKDETYTVYKFCGFKKDNRKLVPSTSKTLELNYDELKYIYPLVLAKDLKNKFEWSKNYIIFPYEEGKRQPVDEETLKKEAPNLYKYLLSKRDDIERQSSYNRRIQRTNEFYGLIRVGMYTYGDYFVAIRDNTKIVANVVKKIKTDWGIEKIPIFDGHVSYVKAKCEKEAKFIARIINSKDVRFVLSNLYDVRSIGSRLPIKIPKYTGCDE
ncbi:MAG: hypothetical protein QW735_04205 [archaeon]